MPEEADGSALVSLLWAAWIYWNIYWWLDHWSSLQQEKKAGPQYAPSGPSFAGRAISSLAGAPAPAKLEALVCEILQHDGAAAIEEFLSQRLEVYEAVVAAFDSGDGATLHNLVSPDVYDAFLTAIEAREAQHRTVRTVFSRIEPAIVDGLIDESRMEVSIRFVGECFKLSRNAAGQWTERAPNRYENVDIWTFGRTPREKTWRVVATEAGV